MSLRHPVLNHPLRMEVLRACAQGATSPKQFSVANHRPLGMVSYHFRELRKAKLIKVTGTAKRRGATEHYFRATPQAAEILDALAAEITALAREIDNLTTVA